MVRKAQIITKHGMVLVNFIEGKQLPFISAESDILLRILPHQSNFPVKTKSAKRTTKVGYREINSNCICIEKGTQASIPFDTAMSRMAKKSRSLLWLDPTFIPTECLASIFSKWLYDTKSTTNLGLGIVIPSSENTRSKNDSFRAWTPTSSGVLRKEFKEIELPVWYPSLAREPEFLREIAEAITFFDIFPVVEFPQVISYAAEKGIASHHYVLDQYRTRTRNFIYLNNNSLAEALITLFGSFQALPRSGKMPRSLVITPGGRSISYLVTLLAGVFAGGIFITPERESPYSKARNTWGFAIFKKCE